MSTIMTAAREYASRPADQRYPTIDALVQTAEAERLRSKEVSYNLKDLRAVAITDPALVSSSPETTIQIESPKGRAGLTHWSFGQTCRMLGAPASYLRDLPPTIAVDCLNYGLQASPVGQTANLLVKAPNGNPTPIIRAATSESYGRVWDSELYSAAQKIVFSANSMNGQPWQNAPTWAGEQIAGGRSDRDSFVMQIDGGSIVTDPSAASDSDGRMYRAVLLGNSEVGAKSCWIDVVLYRYICGNWMLWGAMLGRSFRRRHFGNFVLRDVMRELSMVARQFTSRPASQDEAIIKALIANEIAHTKDAVIDELRGIGYTKDQAEQAYARCETSERVSPRTYWGIAQGTTRLSQDSGFADERLTLDQLAAKLLVAGRTKVAA